MNMLAQIDFSNLEPATGNKFAGKNITDIVSAIIPYFFTIGGILLLLYLLWGGLELMVSRGDAKAAGSAKSKITNALIGFVIVFVAYWIIRAIGVLFNIKGITDIFS